MAGAKLPGSLEKRYHCTRRIEIHTTLSIIKSIFKDAMHKDYSQMFIGLTGLHCEIKERIIQGNIIIDKESVAALVKIK